MESIRVSSLPIYGQIFDYVEVSTQYDFTFGCNITFQFIKEDFPLWGYIGSVYVCYLKSVFLCFDSNRYYTACFVRVFKFKFLDSLQSIATPLLVLLSDEKKARPIQSFFQRTTSSSVLCVSCRSIMSNLEFRKVFKILFLLLLS